MSENDARTMILKMLAEGKITVEESERLLNAVSQENHGRNGNEEKKETKNENRFDPLSGIPFLEGTKLALNLRNMAQTVQQTVQTAIKNIEPQRQDLKEKMKEFGGWMEDMVETMASELSNHNGLPADSMSVDFIVPTPKGFENCKEVEIENIYGEIRVNEGPDFKLLVSGQVSKNVLGELQSSEWFTNNAIRVIDNKLYIGFDNSISLKAIIDLNLTIPAGIKIICKTIDSAVKTHGPVEISEIKTVSGNISADNSIFNTTEIETVSGAIQLDGIKDLNAEINPTQGDLIIRNCGLNKIKIKTVNGDTIIANSAIGLNTDVKITTTAGSINVEKLNGPWKSVEAISRSGEINITWRGDTNTNGNQRVSVKSGGEGAIFYAESAKGIIKFS